MIRKLLPGKGLRAILVTLSLIAFSRTSAQVSVTATGGNPGPIPYITVSDAFAAINAGTHAGFIDIAITGNTTEPVNPIALLNSTGTANYISVNLHPVGGDWVINSAAAPAANRGVIELRGADNVTINGDDPGTIGVRNLTIMAAASANTGVACVRLSSNSATGTDGADNNIVMNCIIIGSRNGATSTVVNYGINMSNYSTTSMTAGAYSSLNTLIYNNEIRRSYHGIYANGSSASYLNTGTVIQSNILGSDQAADNIGLRGIFIAYTSLSNAGAAQVMNNDVRVGTVSASATGYAASISGIELGAANAECNIDGNNIHDVMQPNTGGYGAYGINISSATSNNGVKITNNIIRDMVGSKYSALLNSAFENYGIRVSVAVTGLIINHNTIAFLVPNVTGTVLNSTSAGITITVATAGIAELRNNIIVNMNASTQAMGIYTAATSNLSPGIVNNNNYYCPNGSIGYYNGVMQTSMANWQSATGLDANSVNINPPFVSVVDMHILASLTPNALESGGAVTGTIIDIDGQLRPGPAGSINGGGTAPDIGADEFDGKPIPVNDLAATSFVFPLSSAVVGAGNNFNPQASFTNYGSAAQVNASVRYQIVDASNTIVYDNVSSIPAIPAYTGVATVSFAPANIPAAGNYTIKAIAQLAGDFVTTDDTITGTISAVTPLCGTYHIGSAQSAPFNSLSAAVAALNTAGVTCPIEFLLDDAVYNETSLVQFNAGIPGVTVANTITVRPNTGMNVQLNGAVPSTFIKILSNYVTLDGSNTPAGTTRNLSITNNVLTPVCVHIGSTGISPVTNVTIKNCNVTDSITGNAIVISSGATAGSAGYFNNITIQNNDVRRAQYGIWATAVAAPGNGSGLLLTGNVMTSPMPDAIRRIAFRIEGVDGSTITNNEIADMDTVTADHQRGIYLGTGAINALIKGNTVYNLRHTNAGGSVNAIAAVPGSGIINPANILIDSNFVSNISSAATTTGLTNQTFGISVVGAVIGVSITKNRITNIQNTNTTGLASYGINLQSTGDAASITVANNFISNINSFGSATLDNNAHGIYINDGSGYNIYHNSINMLNTSQTGTEVTGAITIGPAVTTTASLIDIRNNIFSNTGTAGAPYAIYSAVPAANNATTYLNLDYNDYYSAGANLAYFSGANQANLAALQSAFAGANTHSISIQPSFTSVSDLHLPNISANNALDNKGTALPIGGITTDIDGELRPNGTATDIGADEFLAAPLSIKLYEISAANVGNRNRIDWSSASEDAGDRYTIEKSTDGKRFYFLGAVDAKGQAASYTYWDEAPAVGINYYRLKLHSSNGEFSYSKTVQATWISNNGLSVSVYPNPVTDAGYLNVELEGSIGANAVISILDITGKEMNKISVTKNRTEINISKLAPGTYFVKYTDDSRSAIIKINKN